MTEVSLEKLTVPTRIEWKHNLGAAREISSVTQKPLVVFFTASWCGPCQNLKRTTMHSPTVIREIGHNFVPVMLDLDQNRRLAQLLNVRYVPTILVLNPTADRLLHRVTNTGATSFVRELKAASRKLKTGQSIRPVSLLK